MAITTGDAVPGEVIEAAWGDAVRADLLYLDNYDQYLKRGWPQLTTVAVTGSNAPQGITGLVGTATILASPADVAFDWHVTWNYGFAGHSLTSRYRMRIVDASNGTLLATSLYDTYAAGADIAGRTFEVVIQRSAGALVHYLGFQIEIVTASANTNVGGYATCIGIAR